MARGAWGAVRLQPPRVDVCLVLLLLLLVWSSLLWSAVALTLRVGFRAVYLLTDAYHSRRVLPVYAVQLLDGLSYPFFIATLISVDRVLVSTMKPARLQQRQRGRSLLEGLGIVAYVVLSVVVYIRASLVPRCRSWIVGAQAVFITWSLTLFFLVVGRCWDMRRTARCADAVRSLLTIYVRLKRHLASASETSASSGYGSTSAARRHLRMLRRQMEVLSHDGGFPMTSRRKNDPTASPLSSSSSSIDFALSSDSFRANLSRRDVRERPPSVRVSDCATADGVDVEEGVRSCDVVRTAAAASASDQEVLNVQSVQDDSVEIHCSPTRHNQQTWVFFDNRSSAAPEDQLLAEIASGSGRRVDPNSRLSRQLHGLWRAFGNSRRRLYERLRAEAAEWLGISGQLRLQTQHLPRRPSKSRLARSRSRASNISAGQRSSNYKLTQAVSETREPGVRDDIEDQKSAQMVKSSSRLSESTCTELSLFSVPLSVFTGSCATDDISRDEIEQHDAGYTADTEQETARYHDAQRFRWTRDRIRHNTQSSDQSDFTSGRRIELPASATRRLHMRRHVPDATLLRQSACAAVAIALSTLSVCALQIYAALGIYGVLSNERTVKSVWVWLAFQSINR